MSSVSSETPEWLRPILPVCDALAALLSPQAEVAVHDLRTERIVALWNPMSLRKIGDKSLLGDLEALENPDLVFGPYPKVSIDGRSVTSVSAVLTDALRQRRGLLCVNIDRSPLDQIAALATALLSARTAQPAELFNSDWRERIAQRTQAWCLERGLMRHQLQREHRRELVALLDSEGLFGVRGAADLVAQALGVSRANVYALLKETRT